MGLRSCPDFQNQYMICLKQQWMERSQLKVVLLAYSGAFDPSTWSWWSFAHLSHGIVAAQIFHYVEHHLNPKAPEGKCKWILSWCIIFTYKHINRRDQKPASNWDTSLQVKYRQWSSFPLLSYCVVFFSFYGKATKASTSRSLSHWSSVFSTTDTKAKCFKLIWLENTEQEHKPCEKVGTVLKYPLNYKSSVCVERQRSLRSRCVFPAGLVLSNVCAVHYIYHAQQSAVTYV